jgi:hypothetical protein
VWLVAVPIEGDGNLLFHWRRQRTRAAQVAATLVGDPVSQVARAGFPMHGLTTRRQAKSLLGAFVGLHFGHGRIAYWLGPGLAEHHCWEVHRVGTSDFKEYRANGKGGSSANKTKSSLCRDLTNGAWAFPLEFIGR